MSSKPEELARLWLRKADNDLITARQTLLLRDGPTDTACFHAQQAAEKALKALLTYHQVTFPKIHELVRLLDLAIPYLPELEEFRLVLAEMSNYAVEARYPDDWFEPARHDAVEALSSAERIVESVRKNLV
jgi:HEPN domain-containing protein